MKLSLRDMDLKLSTTKNSVDRILSRIWDDKSQAWHKISVNKLNCSLETSIYWSKITLSYKVKSFASLKRRNHRNWLAPLKMRKLRHMSSSSPSSSKEQPSWTKNWPCSLREVMISTVSFVKRSKIKMKKKLNWVLISTKWPIEAIFYSDQNWIQINKTLKDWDNSARSKDHLELSLKIKLSKLIKQ